MPLLATTLVGALLVLGAYAGPGVLALAVVAAVALLAAGVVGASPVAARAEAVALVVIAGTASAVAVLLAEPAPGGEATITPLVWVAGPAVVAVLFVGLARPAARERAAEWLAVAGAGVVLACLLGGLVALGRTSDVGAELVAATAIGVVAGVGVAVPAARRPPAVWSALAAVVGAAALWTAELPGVDLDTRLVVGGAAALLAAVGSAAVSSATPQVAWPARSALVAGTGFALAAPLVTVLAHVVLV